jgi:HK97 family phage major capsid protein
MPSAASFEVPKSRAIKNLNDLLVEARESAEKAQALEERAADEERDLTEDEHEEIEALLNNAIALRKQYDEQLAADQKAARRAMIADTQRYVMDAPSASMTLTRGGLTRVTHMHDRIMDDPKRGFTGGFGEFLSVVHKAAIPGQGLIDERLLKMQMHAAASGMNQGDVTQGGALVPPSYSQQLLNVINQAPENLMQYCQQYTVVGESLTFPVAGDSIGASRYGGCQAYWVAEADQKTASFPRTRQLKLEPQELAVVVFATDKLLRNASALEAYIRQAASEAIMWSVNNAILFGTGTGQPFGIMNSPALITVPEEGAQTALLVLENVNNMYGRLHPRAEQGARWFVNKDVEPALESLNALVGTGGFPVFIASPTGWPNIAEPPQRRLKGLPLHTVEYCQTLGTTGDIILANLGFVALGLQGGIEEAMSIHVRFLWDETAFRFVFNVDAQPILTVPLTPAHGTNTLSAYIALATR